MNEQELADELTVLRNQYNAILKELDSDSKVTLENSLLACSIAQDACMSNSKAKLEQAMFFLDKVIE